ncbi:MAG: hypothetical protein RIM83_09235 [Allomuricauda sp.]
MINWNKYYTPDIVAKELIAKIPQGFYPSNVIDICGGSGNLLSAAYREWENAKYIYADISVLSCYEKANLSNWDIYELNALNKAELERIQFDGGKRLVLANPPFGSLSNNNNLLLKDKLNFRNEAKKLNRIEAEMIVSNISLLRDGDVFAALLPENIFSSEKFENFRNLLFSRFEIIHVGKPDKYFARSEVKTRQFVGISKKHTLSKIESSKPVQEGNLKYIYRGYNNSKLITKPKKIENLGLLEILHFNNPENMPNKKYFIDKSSFKNQKVVETGDLLIIRVGRHAGRIIVSNLNHYGKGVSDYFFIVKSKNSLKMEEIYKIETELLKHKKGLTTSYISKTDVINAFENI